MLSQLRGRILVSIGIAVVTALILGLLGDIRQVGAGLAAFHWLELPAIVGLLLLSYVARWLRWDYLLRRAGLGVGVDAKGGALLFLSGLLAPAIPGASGGLLKPALLKRVNALPARASAPVVQAERLTDVAALLLLAGSGLALYPQAHPALAALLVLSGAGLVGAAVLVARRAAALGFPRPRSVPPILLGLIAWLCEGLAFAGVLRGLGAAGSWQLLLQATVIFSAAALAGLASRAPGGLGAFEAVCAGLLTLLVPLALGPAAAATLLIRLATLWPGVALGALALASFERRYGAVRPSQSTPGASHLPSRAVE